MDAVGKLCLAQQALPPMDDWSVVNMAVMPCQAAKSEHVSLGHNGLDFPHYTTTVSSIIGLSSDWACVLLRILNSTRSVKEQAGKSSQAAGVSHMSMIWEGWNTSFCNSIGSNLVLLS